MINVKKLSLCVLILVLLVVTTSVAVEYEIIDLGSLGGTSQARGINNLGQVVGFSGDNHAFLWTESEGMQDLGTLGGLRSDAYGINDSGQVVGWSYTVSGQQHAFLWTESGGMQDLGTLGGDNSTATGINDSCQIVGYSLIYTSPGFFHNHAFLWTESGGMQDLGTLGGDTSTASGISNSGQIAGTAHPVSGNHHAFLWSESGGMIDLGTLGGDRSTASGINDSCQIVGYSYTASGRDAFLWTESEGMQDLGTLTTWAYGINNLGQVVGLSGDYHAFLWTASGGIQDLGTLGGDFSVAWGINDSSQIVGSSYTTSGEQHACMWIPANKKPVAEAGPDQTVEQTNTAGADVQLDGSGSSDPDGDPLTYDWTWTGGTASGVNPIVLLPPGLTTITLTVSDGQLLDTDTVNINIIDTTPPNVFCPVDTTLKATDSSGIPISNPEIQAWLSSFYATDLCDPAPELSNDAPSVFPLGTTIVTFTATDDSGNCSTCQASLTVIADITVDILGETITPKTKWIKCQIWPPSGYSYADIDIESILLEWQIPVNRYLFNERKQRLTVMFSASGLNLVPSPDPVELTVSGELTDGTMFESSDFVTVVEKGGKKK